MGIDLWKKKGFWKVGSKVGAKKIPLIGLARNNIISGEAIIHYKDKDHFMLILQSSEVSDLI